MRIRNATAHDMSFLWEMLIESVFTSDDERAKLLSNPEKPKWLKKYLDGWGRDGDRALVAEDDQSVPLGAAWFRLFPKEQRGEGILAHEGVPELALAVSKESRGQGIGYALMVALQQSASDGGYKQLMLSVDPANTAALRLYERLGYKKVDTDDAARGTSDIMVLDL